MRPRGAPASSRRRPTSRPSAAGAVRALHSSGTRRLDTAPLPGILGRRNDPDAETEVSPTSHEILEAITDPDTQTGWYDYENGDECAYVYGPTKGAAGRYYNQVINHRHYLSQSE